MLALPMAYFAYIPGRVSTDKSEGSVEGIVVLGVSRTVFHAELEPDKLPQLTSHLILETITGSNPAFALIQF